MALKDFLVEGKVGYWSSNGVQRHGTLAGALRESVDNEFVCDAYKAKLIYSPLRKAPMLIVDKGAEGIQKLLVENDLAVATNGKVELTSLALSSSTSDEGLLENIRPKDLPKARRVITTLLTKKLGGQWFSWSETFELEGEKMIGLRFAPTRPGRSFRMNWSISNTASMESVELFHKNPELSYATLRFDEGTSVIKVIKAIIAALTEPNIQPGETALLTESEDTSLELSRETFDRHVNALIESANGTLTVDEWKNSSNFFFARNIADAVLASDVLDETCELVKIEGDTKALTSVLDGLFESAKQSTSALNEAYTHDTFASMVNDVVTAVNASPKVSASTIVASTGSAKHADIFKALVESHAVLFEKEGAGNFKVVKNVEFSDSLVESVAKLTNVVLCKPEGITETFNIAFDADLNSYPLTEAFTANEVTRTVSEIVNLIAQTPKMDTDGISKTTFSVTLRRPYAAKVFETIVETWPKMFGVGKARRVTTTAEYDGNKIVEGTATVVEKSGVVPVEVSKGRKSTGIVTSDTGVSDIPEDVAALKKLSFEQQITDMKTSTKLVLRGVSNLLLVTGTGGLGKTYNIMQELTAAGWSEYDPQDIDITEEFPMPEAGKKEYYLVKGAISSSMLYRAGFIAREGILIIDDADAVIEDTDGVQLLKALTDTSSERIITWRKNTNGILSAIKLATLRDQWRKRYSKAFDGEEDADPKDEQWLEETMAKEIVPNRYVFKGKVIVISNLKKEKMDKDSDMQALKTRALWIHIDANNDEIIDFVAKVVAPRCKAVGEGVAQPSDELKVKIIQWLRDSQGGKTFSIRRFTRAVSICGALLAEGAAEGEMESMVKYYS